MNNRVKQLRQAAHITQEELARRSGLSRVIISRLENGALETPSWRVIDRVCEGLGCTVDQAFDAITPDAQCAVCGRKSITVSDFSIKAGEHLYLCAQCHHEIKRAASNTVGGYLGRPVGKLQLLHILRLD